MLAQYSNLPLWQQAAPAGQEPAVQEAAPADQDGPDPEQYQEVARQTQERLERQGYCLWQCRQLQGEIILVTQDEKLAELPLKYTAYTLEELLLVADMKESTLRLVHAAKKAGARLLSMEKII